jgi:hypothetical protein
MKQVIFENKTYYVKPLDLLKSVVPLYLDPEGKELFMSVGKGSISY